jgi:hypothetical protein
MMKYVTRAVIFTVSILSSYLITYSVEVRILEETERFRPIIATAVGMAVIVLVFVPIFAYTERITEAIVKSTLQQTKQGAGKVLGVVIFTVIVLVILFALYLDRWFEVSILDAI